MAEQFPDDADGATSPSDAAEVQIKRFDRVSNGLKRGFEALAGTDVPEADKPSWHKRLIAITNSSKHDLATAEDRLERYWDDWEQRFGQRPDV